MEETMLVEIAFYGIAQHDEEVFFIFRRKDSGGLAIIIDTNHYDAHALTMALIGKLDAIPTAYDAWADCLRRTGVTIDALLVKRVIDTQLECRLHLTHGTNHFETVCNLSEGVNMTVRMKAPIHADSEVLEQIADEPIPPTNDDLTRN